MNLSSCSFDLGNYQGRSVTLTSGNQCSSFCPSGRDGLVCIKQQPWTWGITTVGEALLQGFAAAEVYHLAAPYTQKRFACRCFPCNTLDMGDLACGMSLWRRETQQQLVSGGVYIPLLFRQTIWGLTQAENIYSRWQWTCVVSPSPLAAKLICLHNASRVGEMWTRE